MLTCWSRVAKALQNSGKSSTVFAQALNGSKSLVKEELPRKCTVKSHGTGTWTAWNCGSMQLKAFTGWMIFSWDATNFHLSPTSMPTSESHKTPTGKCHFNASKIQSFAICSIMVWWSYCLTSGWVTKLQCPVCHYCTFSNSSSAACFLSTLQHMWDRCFVSFVSQK